MKLKIYKERICLLHEDIENNFYYLKDLKKFKFIQEFLRNCFYYKEPDENNNYLFNIKELKKIMKKHKGLNKIIEYLEKNNMTGIIFRYYIPRSFF